MADVIPPHHESCVIDVGAVLGRGNVIGPYSIVRAGVLLGDDNEIGPHCVLGGPPEHLKHRLSGLPAGGVVIGSRNLVSEFCAIQSGTAGPTRVGDDAFLMDRTHLGHDCTVESRVTTAPGVVIGGHAIIGAGATLGMNAAVHQRRTVGDLAMIGMMSAVTRDTPPFTTAFGCPAEVRGLNNVGLDRAGLGDLDKEWLTWALVERIVPEIGSVDELVRSALARWEKVEEPAKLPWV